MKKLTFQGLPLALIIIICGHSTDAFLRTGCKMIAHSGFHSPTAEKLGETKQHTCYELCRLIPDCKIADYKSSSHECFLGNKLERKADKQYIQYTKSCTHSQGTKAYRSSIASCKMIPHAGVYSPGKHSYVGTTKFGMCESLCKAIPGCRFADYHVSSGKCFMHKKAKTKLHSTGSVQFKKICSGTSRASTFSHRKILKIKHYKAFSHHKPPKFESYKGCKMIERKGFHAADAVFIGVTTDIGCSNLCLVMPNCKRAEYHKSSYECYVHNTITVKLADKYSTLYDKQCGANSEGAKASKQLSSRCIMIKQSGRYEPGKGGFAAVTQPKMCAAICKEIPECNSADFIEKSARCYLHRGKAGTKRSSCCSHYLKICRGH